MDWMEFVSSLVDALVWPLAVVFLVFVFREPLRERVRHLTKFSGPAGTSVEFEKIEVEADAALAAITPEPALSEASAEDGQWESWEPRVSMTRDELEAIVREFAAAGWAIRDLGKFRAAPEPVISWTDEGRPRINFWRSAPETDEEVAERVLELDRARAAKDVAREAFYRVSADPSASREATDAAGEDFMQAMSKFERVERELRWAERESRQSGR